MRSEASIQLTKRDRQAGLTLIEVLVAIAILAAAVGAVLVLMGTQTRGAVALADRAAARIVAENAMVAVVTGERTGQGIEGTDEVGGRSFVWGVARQSSGLPNVEAVTVTVRREDGAQVLTSLGTLVPTEVASP